MSDTQEYMIVTMLVMLAIFSQFHAYRSWRLYPLEVSVGTHERIMRHDIPAPYTYRLLYPQIVERLTAVIR